MVQHNMPSAMARGVCVSEAFNTKAGEVSFSSLHNQGSVFRGLQQQLGYWSCLCHDIVTPNFKPANKHNMKEPVSTSRLANTCRSKHWP